MEKIVERVFNTKGKEDKSIDKKEENILEQYIEWEMEKNKELLYEVWNCSKKERQNNIWFFLK